MDKKLFNHIFGMSSCFIKLRNDKNITTEQKLILVEMIDTMITELYENLLEGKGEEPFRESILKICSRNKPVEQA